MRDLEEEKRFERHRIIWDACKKHMADDTCTYSLDGIEHCPQYQKSEMCLLEKEESCQ